MKRLTLHLAAWAFLIVAFLIWGSANAQMPIHYTVDDLFSGNDSLYQEPDSLYYMLRTNADDTLESDEFNLVAGGGELYLNVRQDSIRDGAATGSLWIATYSGPGFPDKDGWYWHHLYTFDGSNQDTSEFTLSDSTWIKKKYPSKIKYQWRRVTAYRSGLIMNQFYWIRKLKSELPPSTY